MMLSPLAPQPRSRPMPQLLSSSATQCLLLIALAAAPAFSSSAPQPSVPCGASAPCVIQIGGLHRKDCQSPYEPISRGMVTAINNLNGGKGFGIKAGASFDQHFFRLNYTGGTYERGSYESQGKPLARELFKNISLIIGMGDKCPDGDPDILKFAKEADDLKKIYFTTRGPNGIMTAEPQKKHFFSIHLNSDEYPATAIQQCALRGIKSVAVISEKSGNMFFLGVGRRARELILERDMELLVSEEIEVLPPDIEHLNRSIAMAVEQKAEALFLSLRTPVFKLVLDLLDEYKTQHSFSAVWAVNIPWGNNCGGSGEFCSNALGASQISTEELAVYRDSLIGKTYSEFLEELPGDITDTFDVTGVLSWDIASITSVFVQALQNFFRFRPFDPNRFLEDPSFYEEFRVYLREGSLLGHTMGGPITFTPTGANGGRIPSTMQVDDEGQAKLIFPGSYATHGFVFPSPGSEKCGLNSFRNYELSTCPLCPHTCDACPEGAQWIEDEVCGCSPGYWSVNNGQETSTVVCEPCDLKKARCPGGGSIEPRKGWWLNKELLEQSQGSIMMSDALFRCPSGACTDGGNCSEGRTGVVCNVCQEGWARSMEQCTKCTENAEQTRLLVIPLALLIFSILLYGQVVRKIIMKDEIAVSPKLGFVDRISDMRDRIFQTISPTTAATALGFFKVTMSHYQILSSMFLTLNVAWPSSNLQLFRYSRVSTMNVFAFNGPSCLVTGMTSSDKLIAFNMIPPCAVAVIATPGAVMLLLDKLMNRPQEWVQQRTDKVVSNFYSSTVKIFFMIYPWMAFINLSNFHCLDIGTERVLVSDPAEECPLDNPSGFTFVVSLIFAVLYVIGIPGLFLYVLSSSDLPGIARAKIIDEGLTLLIAIYKKASVSKQGQALCWSLGVSIDHFEENDEYNQKAYRLFSEIDEDGNRVVSPTQVIQHLKRSDMLPMPEMSMMKLIRQYSTATDGIVRDTFPEVMSAVLQKILLFTGQETLDDISDKQIRALLEFDWSNKTTNGADPSMKLLSFSSMSSGRMPTGSLQRLDSSFFTSGKSDESSEFRTTNSNISRDILEEKLWALVLRAVDHGIIEVNYVSWDGSAGPREELALRRFGFLFRDYRVRVWYFEVLEMWRKLVLTTMVLFIAPGTYGQVLGAFAFALLFLMFNLRLRPYHDTYMEHLYLYAQFALCATYYYAVGLSFQDIESEGNISHSALATGLILWINLCVLAYPVIKKLWGRIAFLNKRAHRIVRKWKKKAASNYPNISNEGRSKNIHSPNGQNTPVLGPSTEMSQRENINGSARSKDGAFRETMAHLRIKRVATLRGNGAPISQAGVLENNENRTEGSRSSDTTKAFKDQAVENPKSSLSGVKNATWIGFSGPQVDVEEAEIMDTQSSRGSSAGSDVIVDVNDVINVY